MTSWKQLNHLGIKENLDINNNKNNLISLKIKNINFIYLIADNYPVKFQKKFIDEQKKEYPTDSIIMLISKNENKVSILLGLTEDLSNLIDATSLIKVASSVVGGKGGGGRKDLAQAGGNMPSKVNDIFDAMKLEILRLL